MSLLRPFSASDLFSINAINLDCWTETYGVGYYLGYMATWPQLFSVVESASGEKTRPGPGEGGDLMGYVMGKSEGKGEEWHAHVSAITVSPNHRRLGLASMMMDLLEKVGEQDQSYFVDLFVRKSNSLAIGLYESLGYLVYRRVEGYYGGGGGRAEDEDAYDMRKPLSVDKDRKSVKIPNGATDGRDYLVQPEDVVF